ncbi:cyclic lactone autoinducer peptide [Caldisalinibacter kiritimatiensis]|uniref:Cyclic lactone autoinducer peptide n=1 Tax=Caldisalinibacter kiritimatiensis TaxID=1304284 RepID=R1AS93_9FIRM|nr:cyclic lactone autoinducer peptide [Caldisalinibacter kiritimatiensis]EOC99987.1 hypothetical protein L21TH_1979 [Caldisalinibacter kiritimatiensis]
MKKIIRKNVLHFLGIISIVVANTAASSTTMWFFNQVKCPKELLK